MVGDEKSENDNILISNNRVDLPTSIIHYDLKIHESEVISSDEESSDSIRTHEYCVLKIKRITDPKFKNIFTIILDKLTSNYIPLKLVEKYKDEFGHDPIFDYTTYLRQLCLKFTIDDIFIPLAGLYYLYKIFNTYPKLRLHEKNKFRLVWISTIVAYKFLDDYSLKMNNTHWYYVVGYDTLVSSRLSLHKLKIMEIEFLRLLDYNLVVNMSDILNMIRTIVPLEYIF
jgi:hypothetical protein